MARPRVELNSILKDICQNVYFQPPADKKLSYPCIIYSLDKMGITFADNGTYLIMNEYSVMYITRDPDDTSIQHILETLRYCRMNRAYPSDNLHHYVYTVFF